MRNVYNSLAMKTVKERLKEKSSCENEENGYIIINSEKWGVGYKEKFDCYFLCKAPEVIFLDDEDLENMEKDETIIWN